MIQRLQLKLELHTFIQNVDKKASCFYRLGNMNKVMKTKVTKNKSYKEESCEKQCDEKKEVINNLYWLEDMMK